MTVPREFLLRLRSGQEELFANFDRHVLQLIADGQTYDDAASILGASRTIIDTAMQRARTHLQALTDEHAVAIGLRHRIIT